MLFCMFYHGLAQSTFIGTNSDYQHLVERYEIKRGKFAEGLFTTLKPYSRKGIAQLADSVLLKDQELTRVDIFNLMYLLNDNAEWADSLTNSSKRPLLKHFYKIKNSFYNLDNQVVMKAKQYYSMLPDLRQLRANKNPTISDEVF